MFSEVEDMATLLNKVYKLVEDYKGLYNLEDKPRNLLGEVLDNMVHCSNLEVIDIKVLLYNLIGEDMFWEPGGGTLLESQLSFVGGVFQWKLGCTLVTPEMIASKEAQRSILRIPA